MIWHELESRCKCQTKPRIIFILFICVYVCLSVLATPIMRSHIHIHVLYTQKEGDAIRYNISVWLCIILWFELKFSVFVFSTLFFAPSHSCAIIAFNVWFVYNPYEFIYSIQLKFCWWKLSLTFYLCISLSLSSSIDFTLSLLLSFIKAFCMCVSLDYILQNVLLLLFVFILNSFEQSISTQCQYLNTCSAHWR